MQLTRYDDMDGMFTSFDGKWCKFSDVESLQKRCRALEHVMREMLLDGDNLADAVATICEGTIHQLEWNSTRERAKRLLPATAEKGQP